MYLTTALICIIATTPMCCNLFSLLLCLFDAKKKKKKKTEGDHLVKMNSGLQVAVAAMQQCVLQIPD